MKETDLPVEPSLLPNTTLAKNSLSCVNLCKQFRQRSVVHGVSIAIDSGEIVGLLGPNGAGKTTSFYMLSGLIKPDSGSVLLNGKEITLLPMYRRAQLGLGYLPQESSIFRGLTVEQNILVPLEIIYSNRQQRKQRLDQLLAELAIEHLRKTPAVALSGGERRRTEIARALAGNPKFLLLDEPFAGIDPIAITEIRSLILLLRQQGIGILITDHNVRETLKIVNRAYIIHSGQVLRQGSPAEIIQDPLVREVYLGNAFNNT
ncbi:MAG: LPS export ABC transporter ATP-binding protein [Rhodospirillaceae bacterium]|nr:LPS export ABC transporter ATP-binding protein [Rhodospirillaceae bacterium]